MKISTYRNVVREMCVAPYMLTWWQTNIEDGEAAAKALRKWLSETPNFVTTIACGDWQYGNGWVSHSYKVFGLNLSPEKRIELYNFLNEPVTITRQFAYKSEPEVINTRCLDYSTYKVRKT